MLVFWWQVLGKINNLTDCTQGTTPFSWHWLPGWMDPICCLPFPAELGGCNRAEQLRSGSMFSVAFFFIDITVLYRSRRVWTRGSGAASRAVSSSWEVSLDWASKRARCWPWLDSFLSPRAKNKARTTRRHHSNPINQEVSCLAFKYNQNIQTELVPNYNDGKHSLLLSSCQS